MLAALVQHLATGSRKADGSVNASGRAWFFEPGTTTEAQVWLDADALVQATQPIALDAAGKAKIYVTTRTRLKTEYVVSTGVYATLDDFDLLTASAKSVGVRNAGWTGVDVHTGSIVAGGDTTLDAILTLLAASFGGPNGMFQESPGATPRPISDVIAGIQISVKDFGAVGNGIADDTTAIQAAINRVVSLGGGRVWLDPGTYRISSPLTLSSATGVTIAGSGRLTSVIENTSATGNAFTIASSATIRFAALKVTSTAGSTGTAIAATASGDIKLEDLVISGHQIGVDFSGANASETVITGCSISTTTNAAARAVRYNPSGSGAQHLITGSSSLFANTGKAVEYNGTASRASITDSHFNTNNATCVLFNAALTGTRFVVAGCPSIGAGPTVPFDLTGLATDPAFEQYGNGVEGYVVTQASGGGGGSNHTPDLSRGKEIHVRLTSGGAAVCTINAPVPAQVARGVTLLLRLTAAAGGAITWTFNAVFVLIGGGTTIAGVDGTTTLVPFNWDPQTSEWRQACAAAVTTT